MRAASAARSSPSPTTSERRVEAAHRLDEDVEALVVDEPPGRRGRSAARRTARAHRGGRGRIGAQRARGRPRTDRCGILPANSGRIADERTWFGVATQMASARARSRRRRSVGRGGRGQRWRTTSECQVTTRRRARAARRASSRQLSGRVRRMEVHDVGGRRARARGRQAGAIDVERTRPWLATRVTGTPSTTSRTVRGAVFATITSRSTLRRSSSQRSSRYVSMPPR